MAKIPFESQPSTNTGMCKQALIAEDVSVEVDGVVRRWPKLLAHCTLDERHVGEHKYSKWLDPETYEPVFADERSTDHGT